MTWLIPIGLVSLVLLVVSILKLSGYGSEIWVIWVVVSVFSLLGCILVPTIVYSSRSVGRTTCRNWQTQSGYKTKFVVLNWADGGTCLAKAPDGRWVPNTQIIINTPSKP